MDLSDVEGVAAADHHLAVLCTTRADGTVQASVVNAGVLDHPLTGEPVVGLVAAGRAKLANLRRRPQATVVFRAQWQWIAVEGPGQVVGPDDYLQGFDPAQLPALLRAIFTVAGGTHEDWAEYDRVMAEERRAAVFVAPRRVYSNRG